MGARKAFGKFFKELRIRKGKTLRQFCLENGLDPGSISKLERGRLPLPQSSEKLEDYVRALELKECSDEWREFFDLAAAVQCAPPIVALLNDQEVLPCLPLIFGMIRGKSVTSEQVDELIELIRGI